MSCDKCINHRTVGDGVEPGNYREPPDDVRGIVTKFSYEQVDSDTYFTIEQGKNKVFLSKSEVLIMLAGRGPALVKRWKITDGTLEKAYQEE